VIFVDTSAWYADFVSDDEHHASARRFFDETSRAALLTTDYVVAETRNLLTVRGYVDRARHAVGQFLSENIAQVVWIDRQDVFRAAQVFREFSDKRWSFTDCVSNAVIQRRGIKQALAFDKHFASSASSKSCRSQPHARPPLGSLITRPASFRFEAVRQPLGTAAPRREVFQGALLPRESLARRAVRSAPGGAGRRESRRRSRLGDGRHPTRCRCGVEPSSPAAPSPPCLAPALASALAQAGYRRRGTEASLTGGIPRNRIGVDSHGHSLSWLEGLI
jgi:predicted nucleic acid-binding protein